MSDNALEVQQVRKKTLARNRKRKQRLAASAQDRSTELSQQRKRMRLLRGRETPARRSARLEAMLHALSREAFCTMCIPSNSNNTGIYVC